MPIIHSAIKKLRQDKKREVKNEIVKKTIKSAIKKAASTKTKANIVKAISLVNKAAKRNIFHKNKAARITSRLAKISVPVEKKHLKS